jgi:hypothetical protein
MVLAIGAAALGAAGCAGRRARAEASPPKPVTMAGIMCSAWAHDASMRAGVTPRDVRPDDPNTVVVKVVIHLMQADLGKNASEGGDVGELWRASAIRGFFGWDGQINAIWKPTVALRLARVEDCHYSPAALRFDGKDHAAIFTPVLETPKPVKEVEPEALSKRLSRNPDPLLKVTDDLATMGATLEALIRYWEQPERQDAGSFEIERRQLKTIQATAPTWAGDEWERLRGLEDLRSLIADLTAIDTKVGGLRAQLRAGSDRCAALGAAECASMRTDLTKTQEALAEAVRRAKHVRVGLNAMTDTLPSNAEEDLRQAAMNLTDGAQQLGLVVAVARAVADQKELAALGRSLAPLREDPKTIRTWGAEHGNRERERTRQEAGQLFRAVNRRFAAVDPDALHVVLWWAINEIEVDTEFQGDRKLGYARAAERGGPAVWADVRCLRETRWGCARLLGHEVGHALTLRHVCKVKFEPNIDDLPDCEHGLTLVEGCRVDTKTNLMDPDPKEARRTLEGCQRDQAQGEAMRQFGR